MTIDFLTTLLGWCTLINTGLLIFSTVILVAMRKPVINIHSKLFGLNREQLQTAYFQYLGNFKIAVILFNLAPYIALKLMAW